MEIHWTHFEALSDEQREAVESRIRALAEGHSDLIDVRLMARTSGHHRHGQQEVRLACQARGKELVVRREREEIARALDEVLDEFEREVRKLRERRRERRSDQRTLASDLGLIDRVLGEDGYGFILTDAGDQVYFHRNAVSGGLEFDQLLEGQRVGLSVEAGDKGPQASAVFPAPPDAPGP
jgi:ribosomal subunit interface protein